WRRPSGLKPPSSTSSFTSSTRLASAESSSSPSRTWRSTPGPSTATPRWKILERRYDRKAADKFRYQAVFEQVLRLDLSKDLALLSILGRNDLGAETDRARPAACRNDFLEASKRAA